MPVIAGKNVEEIVYDYNEGLGPQGPFSNKSYLCAWEDRFAVANAMVGIATSIPVLHGPVILPLGMRHPESPNMIVQQVEIIGKGVPTQGVKQLQYPFALIRAVFGRPTWSGFTPDVAQNLDPNSRMIFATQEMDFAYEIVDFPGQGLTYEDTGLKIPEQHLSIRIPYVSWSITLHYFPYLPSVDVQNLTGTINKYQYLGVLEGFLRFDGARNHYVIHNDGSRVIEMNYKFSVRKVARWDEVWNPATSAWDRPLKQGGSPLVGSQDFGGVDGTNPPIIPNDYFQAPPYPPPF